MSADSWNIQVTLRSITYHVIGLGTIPSIVCLRWAWVFHTWILSQHGTVGECCRFPVYSAASFLYISSLQVYIGLYTLNQCFPFQSKILYLKLKNSTCYWELSSTVRVQTLRSLKKFHDFEQTSINRSFKCLVNF